jgi:hypothetical protein
MALTLPRFFLPAMSCLLVCGCTADQPANPGPTGVYYIGGKTQLPGMYPLPRNGISLKDALTLAQAWPPQEDSVVMVSNWVRIGEMKYENRTCVMALPLMEKGAGKVQIQSDDQILYTLLISNVANAPLHSFPCTTRP